MRWLDVCGPPGSGKSTLCDHLWPPHAVSFDGYGVPVEWDSLLSVCDALLEELNDHSTYHLLLGMTKRSLHKMAAVWRRQDGAVYIQTGLAQRGLGFGWRLAQRGKVKLLRPFFQAMPVSLGVALVDCPPEIAIARNHKRIENADTAHEDRAHMVPLMQPAIEIMREELSARSVPFVTIDATKPINAARRDLIRFTAERATQTEAFGYCGEVAAIC